MASAKEIPPGGEGKIDVTFKTGSGSGGKREKHITVTCNDPEKKSVGLTVKTEVVETLGITPIRISFNQVKRGQEHVRFASVSGEDKDAVKLTGFESSNPNIKAEINPKGFDGDTYQQIKIILMPTMKTGRFFERVKIRTDHKTIKDIQLNVIGSVVGDVTVAPNQVHFGLFRKDKKPSERFLTIRSVGEVTFKIIEVTSSIPEVTTSLETVVAGKEYRLRSALNDSFAGSSLNGKLTIKTDLMNDGIIEIPIAGRVLPPAAQQGAPAIMPSAGKPAGGIQPAAPAPPR
ncbi:MAG: DUF1573 domain-containing protein [Deltaproteobacteria bacterium]|nr:DUF1573 domain-containing protein [Deltaproteobacteria bacterium]